MLSGCSTGPDAPLTTGDADAAAEADGGGAQQVDLLIMLDPRKGICPANTRMVGTLVEQASKLGADGIDLQVAVRSTWRECDADVTTPRAESDACHVFEATESCTTAGDCASYVPGQAWSCVDASGSCPEGVFGGPTTSCRLKCQDSTECQAAYGADTACSPSGVCVVPIPPGDCPEVLPRTFGASQLELLQCRIPWDDYGPNCSNGPQTALESTRLLLEDAASDVRRAGAPLVVLFASYHDECSGGPDGPTGDKYDCYRMDDELGISTPDVMADYASRFAAAAGGDDRFRAVVLVADAFGTAEEIAADRAAFTAARQEGACEDPTYCQAGGGYGYFGDRWIAFAEALGDRDLGEIFSICDPEGPTRAATAAIAAVREVAAATRTR